MVLPKHAGDLDPSGRFRKRLCPFTRAGITNQWPAISAGNFHQQLKAGNAQPGMTAQRTQDACAPQKENQCQEN
jgi:hypothetical protein